MLATTQQINATVMNPEEQLRHRANSKDRPQYQKECRVGTSPECRELGHQYIFRIKDNYGCCKICGDEVLT